VFGDKSESPFSILETERFRPLIFFKLEEEKFFLKPALEWLLPGEPERGIWPFISLSFVKVCVSACASSGVGGCTTSAGLGIGYADVACRADWVTGILSDELGNDFRGGKPAVLGTPFVFGSSGGGIDGG